MPNFLDFENRLQKKYKHLHKWASRQNITCYRIYDNDIPEFPFSIDLYANYLYICEYQRKLALTPQQHQQWLNEVTQICSQILNIQTNNIFFKTRQKQTGTQQYQKTDSAQQFFTVKENDLLFYVNLTDYLDTGLFLDHRITRQMVQAESNQKHVLNLFAYTGSFTVYAAAGNATTTTTLDMSATYLQWAKNNMKLNNFDTNTNKNLFVQTDVIQWLQHIPPVPTFDLIVFDPPTFSNSKRMQSIFEVQNHHAPLLNKLLAITNPNGVIYFSTNFKKFKLYTEDIQPVTQIKNITNTTIPLDFQNTKNIHYCFKIYK